MTGIARNQRIIDIVLLEQLLEHLSDCAFFAKDRKLRYIAANTAQAKLFGVKRPNDLYGKRVGHFLPAPLAHYFEMQDRQILATGKPILNRLDSGVKEVERPVWLLCSRLPLRGEKRKVIGIISIAKRFAIPKDDPVFQRVARTAERLQEDFADPPPLEELASEANVSKSQLSRDFKRLFGLTPGAYLRRARIEQAMQLLDGDMSVSDIAYRCGYSDQSAFARRFHESTGMTPSAYRASMSEAE